MRAIFKANRFFTSEEIQGAKNDCEPGVKTDRLVSQGSKYRLQHLRHFETNVLGVTIRATNVVRYSV